MTRKGQVKRLAEGTLGSHLFGPTTRHRYYRLRRSGYFGNKEEVEEESVERQRIEDEFTKRHAPPPELKQKLERAREQMLARRS